MSTSVQLLEVEVPRLPCSHKGWLYFSADRASQAAAVKLCRSCPVLARCAARTERLETAMGTELPGVWAATTEADRRRARARTR